MSDVPCEIIKDLLPLYFDDVCSEDSRKMVESHLLECEGCRRELRKIEEDINIPKEEMEKNRKDGTVVKNISTLWERSRFNSFLKGGVIGSLVIALLILGYYGLFHWEIKSVPTEVVEVKDVRLMDDGKIAYHAKINDDYSLSTLKYHMDGKGNFYITPLRPVIKQRREQPVGILENGYDFIDIEDQEAYRSKDIQKIYYGTPKDRILIWEKGMELPEASEELEEYFGF
jgi:hypothetical protein